MRKFITSIGLIALVASVAGAQTLSPPFGQVGFDDGSAENSWKVRAPTVTGDFFSVDFDNTYTGGVIALVAVTNETGTIATNGEIGLYPDNLTVDPSGTTPDLSSPLTNLLTPTGLTGGGCGTGEVAYDTPDVTLTGTNVHLGYVQAPGDSVLWLCADSGATISGRSYFTTNSYATTAIPFTVNWMLRLAIPEGPAGTFLVNGNTGNATAVEGTDVTLSFWGNPGVSGEVTILGLVGPFLKLLTGVTGTFPPGAADNVFAVTGRVTCNIIPRTFAVAMGGFWGDTVNLKPNGKIRPLATNTVVVTFVDDPNCGAPPPSCFGIKDDGILDSTIWKVQSPAGSQDYFSVRHRTNDTGANNLTAVEVASWDFCAATQSWAEVGIYPANLTVDPNGDTPDAGNPITTVSGSSATMGANAGDWTFPATVYDVPDVGANTTTIYHAATKWNSIDSCVWLASDTTGTDDDAGQDCATVPTSTSFFTLDGYATTAVPFTGANWMIRINWN